MGEVSTNSTTEAQSPNQTFVPHQMIKRPTAESSQDHRMMPEIWYLSRVLGEGVTLIANDVEFQGLQCREGQVTVTALHFSRDLITERLESRLNCGMWVLHTQVLMKPSSRGKLTVTGGALILGLRSMISHCRRIWCLWMFMSKSAVSKCQAQLLHYCTGVCLRLEVLFAVFTWRLNTCSCDVGHDLVDKG